MDFIDLPDFELIQFVKRSNQWVARLTPTSRCFLCPICGGKSTVHKCNKTRTLRHRFTPYFGFLYVEIPVYHQQCSQCTHIWSVQWRGIPQRGKATTLFKNTLIKLCQNNTLLSAARTLKVPYTTVERWYYKWAEEEVNKLYSDQVDPIILCLDDFAIHKGHRYAVSLVDYTTGELRKLGKGRNRSAIQQALKDWPHSPPQVVVTDLAPGMATTVQEIWPDTIMAADPFHVIQLFTKELDQLRKKLSNQKGSQRKRRQWTRLLTTRPTNLTFKEHLKLEEWLSQNAQLQELYQALEGIRRVYIQRVESNIRFALSQRIEHYLYAEYSNVCRIAKTIIQWREPIINAILLGVDNGIMEGLNNKVKLIKRRGCGYRNFHHFQRRVQLETAM